MENMGSPKNKVGVARSLEDQLRYIGISNLQGIVDTSP